MYAQRIYFTFRVHITRAFVRIFGQYPAHISRQSSAACVALDNLRYFSTSTVQSETTDFFSLSHPHPPSPSLLHLLSVRSCSDSRFHDAPRGIYCRRKPDVRRTRAGSGGTTTNVRSLNRGPVCARASLWRPARRRRRRA